MKNFLLLSLILPIFAITSCKTAKDEYEGRIEPQSDRAHVDIKEKGFPTTYDSGKKIEVDKLVFTFDGNVYPPLTEGEKITDTNFFITRNRETPTLSFVKPANYVVQSNAESADMKFYVAIKSGDHIYVAKEEITITVKNAGAMKPWVWYVVTAVVIFGVVGMVFFTRRYKEKHG